MELRNTAKIDLMRIVFVLHFAITDIDIKDSVDASY